MKKYEIALITEQPNTGRLSYPENRNALRRLPEFQPLIHKLTLQTIDSCIASEFRQTVKSPLSHKQLYDDAFRVSGNFDARSTLCSTADRCPCVAIETGIATTRKSTRAALENVSSCPIPADIYAQLFNLINRRR